MVTKLYTPVNLLVKLTVFLLPFIATVLWAEEQPTPLTITLEDAINRALEANRGLIGSAEGIARAELTLSSSGSDFELQYAPNFKAGLAGGGFSGTNPSLGGGYDFKKKFHSGLRISVSPSLYRTKGVFRDADALTHKTTLYDANVRTKITHPLLRGRDRESNLSSVKQAEFGLRAARRTHYTDQVNLIVRTVTAVYEVLKKEITLELNQESYQRLEQAVKTAKVKEKIGLADAVDLYRAELEFRQADENLVSARESYQDALDALKEILAMPLALELHVEASLGYDLVGFTEEEAITTALDTRIELEQARDQAEDRHREARHAEHQLLPELDVVVNYSVHGEDQVLSRAVSHLNTNTWGVGFQSDFDMDKSSKRSQFQQKLIAAAAAERGIEEKQDQIIIEVRRNLRQLARAQNRVEVQTDKLHQTEGKLRFSQVKFERGLANNFDVIQAEKEMHQAGTALIGAVTDYIVGTYRLRQALGTLLDKPDVWR